MPIPRVGRFSQDATLSWTDASLFNGFILVGIVPPTSGGTDWAQLSISDYYPPQRVPVFARVPITSGKYNSVAGLFFTADLEPPNSRYIAFWYDATGRLITPSASAQFQVTTDPFTPPTPTLTVPSVGSVNPTPDT